MAQAAVSKQDRATFRDRLKDAIKSAGTSGKKLEKAIGARSGTLSKIYGGKKALTAEALTAMAHELGHDPADLIAGTGWQSLFAEDDAGSGPGPDALGDRPAIASRFADDDYASRETEVGAYDRTVGPRGATTPEPTPALPEPPAAVAAPAVPTEPRPAPPKKDIKEKSASKGLLGSFFGGLFGRE